MKAEVNKHGLSRDISDPIARQIRQKSGFGCIFCGVWIYNYEHIIPEFHDATVHDPEKICLLCATHHQKVTSKRLSKQQVFDQYKHPITFQRGYANDYLEMNKKIGIVLGRIFMPEPKNDILVVDGMPLISVKQPTATEPMKLSAKFFDNKGTLVMEIIDNEMRGFVKNWDIEQEGARTIIRRKRRDIVLQMVISSANILKIEKINMFFGSAKLISNSQSGKIFIQTPSGATIDFDSGEIMTDGITITGDKIQFDKGMIMGAQKGLNLAEMDYQSFMETGRIHSVIKPLANTNLLKQGKNI